MMQIDAALGLGRDAAALTFVQINGHITVVSRRT